MQSSSVHSSLGLLSVSSADPVLDLLLLFLVLLFDAVRCLLAMGGGFAATCASAGGACGFAAAACVCGVPAGGLITAP